MAQDYTIKSWQPWVDQETDEPIRDNYGNHKGSVTFDEYAAQPVDATFKEPPAIGAKKYGSIEEYKTKAGKTRLKFKSEQRVREGYSIGGPAPVGKTYQPRDDMAIRAQWAIGQAVQLHALRATALGEEAWRFDNDWIANHAKQFFAMVDRVKGSESTQPAQDSNWVPSEEELQSFQQYQG